MIIDQTWDSVQQPHFLTSCVPGTLIQLPLYTQQPTHWDTRNYDYIDDDQSFYEERDDDNTQDEAVEPQHLHLQQRTIGSNELLAFQDYLVHFQLQRPPNQRVSTLRHLEITGNTDWIPNVCLLVNSWFCSLLERLDLTLHGHIREEIIAPLELALNNNLAIDQVMLIFEDDGDICFPDLLVVWSSVLPVGQLSRNCTSRIPKATPAWTFSAIY
ncbi:hypothetical protein SAMD00019534_035920 [Acytostelium subglobosum LB1]|uniref:hypothetical protein n=1 Tax=Acytostelium subglobosum LB1 TaxID=1410327 RepID=UPI0006448A88|nr:hypothetical protein SAMD00019534_035920 [Acytostelium subglobosum LB1]GAM20417.1 hypothetical protein SAMD00019534_035920 [Acytostelium subglobosum LB1]|eukprot:XP_012759938.1 hypothetical protein SAMD00019534_035920 [Acytostelium subglobosum LB1]